MADQGAEGLLSPYLRKKRFNAVFPYLRGTILDFGCGSGALAASVQPNHYLGVEIDAASLQQAVSNFSQHRFLSHLPNVSEKFDTIVALAVIEHVSDPVEFLRQLATYLNKSPQSYLVVTTPHPSVEWVHAVGAAIGLFSQHANEEHHDLLDRIKLNTAGELAGLKLVNYHRFLFGANQIAVFERVCS